MIPTRVGRSGPAARPFPCSRMGSVTGGWGQESRFSGDGFGFVQWGLMAGYRVKNCGFIGREVNSVDYGFHCNWGRRGYTHPLLTAGRETVLKPQVCRPVFSARW